VVTICARSASAVASTDSGMPALARGLALCRARMLPFVFMILLGDDRVSSWVSQGCGRTGTEGVEVSDASRLGWAPPFAGEQALEDRAEPTPRPVQPPPRGDRRSRH